MVCDSSRAASSYWCLTQCRCRQLKVAPRDGRDHQPRRHHQHHRHRRRRHQHRVNQHHPLQHRHEGVLHGRAHHAPHHQPRHHQHPRSSVEVEEEEKPPLQGILFPRRSPKPRGVIQSKKKRRRRSSKLATSCGLTAKTTMGRWWLWSS